MFSTLYPVGEGDGSLTVGLVPLHDAHAVADPTNVIPVEAAWQPPPRIVVIPVSLPAASRDIHDYCDGTLFVASLRATEAPSLRPPGANDGLNTLSDTGAQFNNECSRDNFVPGTFVETPGRRGYDAGGHAHDIIGNGIVTYALPDNCGGTMFLTLQCECAPTLPHLINSSALHLSGRYTLVGDIHGQHWTDNKTGQVYTCETRDGQSYFVGRAVHTTSAGTASAVQRSSVFPVSASKKAKPLRVKPRPTNVAFRTQIEAMTDAELLHRLRHLNRQRQSTSGTTLGYFWLLEVSTSLSMRMTPY